MPSPPDPPMTLSNMRELGVRSLFVTCELCHHEAFLPADDWPDAMLVRTFAPRMVCTVCRIVDADAKAELAGVQGARETGDANLRTEARLDD